MLPTPKFNIKLSQHVKLCSSLPRTTSYEEGTHLRKCTQVKEEHKVHKLLITNSHTQHNTHTHASQVLSQRRSWLHRLLAYEDEVLALVSLALDWHSLHTTDATFAEGLYGLCRRSTVPAAPSPAAPLGGAHGGLGLSHTHCVTIWCATARNC